MEKESILIVEDENLVAKNIEFRLSSMGYKITGIAFTGEEAVELTKKTHPDIALVDIKLKGEIDGIETAIRIKKEHDIPIIYLTAYADEDTLKRTKLTEPFGYIFKPFDTQELNASIQMAIYKHEVDKKLKESEIRYRTLYENNPLMIFTVDLEGIIISVNINGYKELGYSEGELVGQPVLNVFYDEDKPIIKQHLVNCLNNPNKTFSWEVRKIHKNGNVIWIRETASAINNECNQILIVCENITEQKKAAEKIREMSETFRMVTEEASDLIAIVDLQGKRIYNSQSYYKILGDPESLRGTDSFKEIHPDDKERIKNIFFETIKSGIGQLAEYRFLLKDGTVRYIESQGNLIKTIEGKPEKILIVSRDITCRKKTEEALRESEKRYYTLIEHIPVGMYRTYFDSNANFIMGNPAILEMFGFSSMKDFLDSKPLDLYANPNDRELFLEKIRENGEVKDLQIKFKRKDNTPIWGSLTAKLIYDETNSIVYIDGMIEDITERKTAEENIIKVNEELKSLNASKDKLFSIIAHDLRSPFTSLLGFTEYMARYYNELSTDELQDYSYLLYQSAQNVFGLLENLLHWSRMRTDKFEYTPEEFNVSKIFEKVTNLFSLNAKNKKIEIISLIDKDYSIYADENMAFTILRNLVSNSIKFTKPGGSIKISTCKKGNFLEIAVEDTGIGISIENIKKLFNQNIHYTIEGTDKEKGTGLGLILCKEMLEKCGGELKVESTEGKGSKFTFTLPIT